MEGGERRKMIFHLRLGQVRKQRVDFILELGLVREGRNLGRSQTSEIGMVGDIKEALAIPAQLPLLIFRHPSRVAGRELDVELLGALRLGTAVGKELHAIVFAGFGEAGASRWEEKRKQGSVC